MMVPRAFPRSPLPTKQSVDLDEKQAPRRRRVDDAAAAAAARARTPARPVSALSQSLSQQRLGLYQPSSDPVKIPTQSDNHARRPGLSTLQNPHAQPRSPTSSSSSSTQAAPKRKESVQEVLSATTIPIRRRPKPRLSQRIPNCDHVADFSKLLRDDVPSSGEASLSGSWTNPQFEELFGTIDGLLDGQMMMVGSEDVDDAGVLSTRSVSSESMPSLASPDDFSTPDLASCGSPATTVRSPPDHRSRQLASSEDCSHRHPLLALEDDVDDDRFGGTPDLGMSPAATPSSSSRREPTPSKRKIGSFKSSLTASLQALKTAAAQTVSNMTTNPHNLVPPDPSLTGAIFDFQPALTDDRRPPPSDEPPSAALRRYLNPQTVVPPDSPAQLHFWLDEKPAFQETKPRLKIKRKYQKRPTTGPGGDDPATTRSVRRNVSLPPVVPLATCIPSSIRTAHASSPPTWLEADGTPSNKHRAAQALWEPDPAAEGQPRPREPRENRDFLRVFVAEMNMRRSGKLSDAAVGHARLWLPPVVEAAAQDKPPLPGGSIGKPVTKRLGPERWPSWSSEDDM